MSQPTDVKKIIVQRAASVLSVRNDNIIVCRFALHYYLNVFIGAWSWRLHESTENS